MKFSIVFLMMTLVVTTSCSKTELNDEVLIPDAESEDRALDEFFDNFGVDFSNLSKITVTPADEK